MDCTDAAPLVTRVASAMAAQAAALADPVAGLVAAGMVPAAELAVARWRGQQADNVEKALFVGAEAADLPIDEMLERLTADPTRLVFLSEALTGAARSTYSERVRALGRALASGALAADDAKVDEERIFVGLLSALEASHVRILLRLSIPRDKQPLGIAPQQPDLADAAGVSYRVAGHLLAALDRQGLATWRWGESFPASYQECRGASASEKFWSSAGLAGDVLDRLRLAGTG